VLKVSRSLRLEDVAGEQLFHPLQISFCIVRELHRRQALSRSTNRLSAKCHHNDGRRRAPLTVVIYFLKEMMAAMFRDRTKKIGVSEIVLPETDWSALRSIAQVSASK
jgi:hypothetical protein